MVVEEEEEAEVEMEEEPPKILTEKECQRKTGILVTGKTMLAHLMDGSIS
jgi:hypothetical protein